MPDICAVPVRFDGIGRTTIGRTASTEEVALLGLGAAAEELKLFHVPFTQSAAPDAHVDAPRAK